jgi:hypothetical protein
MPRFSLSIFSDFRFSAPCRRRHRRFRHFRLRRHAMPHAAHFASITLRWYFDFIISAAAVYAAAAFFDFDGCRFLLPMLPPPRCRYYAAMPAAAGCRRFFRLPPPPLPLMLMPFRLSDAAAAIRCFLMPFSWPPFFTLSLSAFAFFAFAAFRLFFAFFSPYFADDYAISPP